ncbi:rRNA maturation RNase YbeY [Pontibacter sp. JAM-7]|uniref:rRNA maturation RNase YbeY n=1 Tax=Pontibacter sp. JAM-7 TaxID=3366581 RepID=UPI003AF4DCCB
MSTHTEVQYQIDETGLPTPEQLAQWVNAALAERHEGGELCIRIVDKTESQHLNSTYRHKDKPTNVLSFPFEVPEGIPLDILGDLVICADVVAEEAAEQGKASKDHWAHMVIHGCLHLLGFDHINETEAEEMEALERQILAGLNIADPYR